MAYSLVTLRDANQEDLPVLTAIRSPEALHRGRLRDAKNPDFHYFVIQHEQVVVGFVSLVYRRPASWSNSQDLAHLPEINDLFISEVHRGKGCGSAAIHALERIASQAGHTQLYISVEPFDNPRAYALYQRLGYRAIQQEPYLHHWAALDGDDHLDSGEAWLVDMVKSI
jgi:GNAT superfamily N-acetyltransferase